jgi:hypothetical protein
MSHRGRPSNRTSCRHGGQVLSRQPPWEYTVCSPSRSSASPHLVATTDAQFDSIK